MPPRRTKKTQKKVLHRYTVDCTRVVDDGIIDPGQFEQFLSTRIKVNGKTGVLGDAVTVSRDKAKISIAATIPFSKPYIKYLTKKYLKQKQLRDLLRVVATDKPTFEIRYFNIQDDDLDDEEEE
eukprot:TRINITY_DN13272_c0_g1_i1.p1 TRINITY_DN13272_c0_g1~~TRINITY_DN13272_c0_g1_i1.p1  ORF type:complete len:132 (-),score=46.83 TRINITY_DN13272_c0_g1_i1:140-511(-)